MTGMENNPHKKHRERLRKQFLDKSLKAFHDHQKLELLLFYSIPVRDTNGLAHDLLNKYGSLSAVFDAEYTDLVKTPGIGANTATLIKLVQEMSAAYLDDKTSDVNLLNTTEALADFVRYKFLEKENEEMMVICLDGREKLIHYEFMAVGSVNAAAVNIRTIAEIALARKAASVVVAHNHPRGLALPSREDIETTKDIIRALRILGVKLADSLVVAPDDILSMKESRFIRELFME